MHTSCIARCQSWAAVPTPGIEENEMKRTTSAENKALVLKAFDTLFNKRDYVAAEHYWSPNYIQHSAHIGPGREGLFSLIKSPPPTLKYEPGLIVAEGEFVIVHGRFSGHGGPKNWIAADILRTVDGLLADFAVDVVAGLSARHKQLPPKYFYDAT